MSKDTRWSHLYRLSHWNRNPDYPLHKLKGLIKTDINRELGEQGYQTPDCLHNLRSPSSRRTKIKNYKPIEVPTAFRNIFISSSHSSRPSFGYKRTVANQNEHELSTYPTITSNSLHKNQFVIGIPINYFVFSFLEIRISYKNLKEPRIAEISLYRNSHVNERRFFW